jgi:hypothetical protein
MKKLTIAIAAVLVMSVFSKLNAQKFSIGPTGGFGHSWINNSGGDAKFNPMWNAGIAFMYSTKTNFGIGADVKYSSEGNKANVSGVDNIINANYIRVPVKLAYFAGKYGNAVRPKIYVGPSFGFLSSANATTEVSNTKVKTDIKDDLKNFDFGVTAGAGINFRLAPNTWLNTDLAFYQGLSDMTKNDNKTLHNGNIGVNVGLLVGL